MVQKIHSKMHPFSCINTHHYVTDLVNHGMVKNTKNWISWEWNITSLLNKINFNFCLGWNILRSYRFVTEVTFKNEKIKYLENITFLWNKKNVNLRLKSHILRSYCFVAEVTFTFRNKKFFSVFVVKIGYSEQLNKPWNKSSSIIAILDFFVYADIYGFVDSFQKKCYVICNDIISWYVSNWFMYFAYFCVRF